MFETKIEVDKHVNNCLRNVNDPIERNLRGFAFAKLYYKVGEYEQSRRYITAYLSSKPLSTEGLNLLGKTLEMLNKNQLAVEAYRKSLNTDPHQNSLVLKICELLATDEIGLDLSGARYYCEKAQSFDPHNPIVFNLKERLVASESRDPNDVTQLLLSEIGYKPTNVQLRVRLLQHLLNHQRVKDAYDQVVEIEQTHTQMFGKSLSWYETAAKVLVQYQRTTDDFATSLSWEFWVLLASVLDRLAALTLAENTLKNLPECAQVLFNLDQTLLSAVQHIKTCKEKPLVQEFLTHYTAQVCFHLATLTFKQVKRDAIKSKEGNRVILPLLFAAYHAKPAEMRSMWLDNSTETRRQQVFRWHREAAFRCSQTGHLLLTLSKDKKLTVIEKAIQATSGLWREQVFKTLFLTRDQLGKIDSSYFVSCPDLIEIRIRLPDLDEVYNYDEVAQFLHPDSLHLFIWTCLNQRVGNFRCTVFEGLQYSIRNLNNCAAESLNLLDVEAFIYCAALCAEMQLEEKKAQIAHNRSQLDAYPASVTDPLGTVNQTKWLQAAYKMYRNEYGAELSELRLSLIRGIEVVRCVGHHGLDVKLLTILANVFSERAKKVTKQSEVEFNEARSELYWKAALPVLEKLEKGEAVAYNAHRLFEYKSKEMSREEIARSIEDAKLFLGAQLMKKKEYEKATGLFQGVHDPYASFYQAQIYKTMGNELIGHNKESVTSEMRSRHLILLSRARDCLYLTVDRLRDPTVDRKHPLNACLATEIEKIERLLSRIDSDTTFQGESDVSSVGSAGDHLNHTNYSFGTPRLRLDSTRREARPSPERLDAQLRQMQATRDVTVNQVLEQNRTLLETNRNLTDEFRGFKEAVTGKLDDLKTTMQKLETTVEAFNFETVTDLIQEMRREIAELKERHNKTNPLSEEDLYGLEDDYNFNPGNLYPNLASGRLPANVATYQTAVYPNLYPMYQYPGLGLAQSGALPYGQDDLRALSTISQGVPLTATVSQVKPTWDMPVSTSNSVQPFKETTNIFTTKNAPVNVVITSSDPLPTTTHSTQQILSVTIPPQHLKGTKKAVVHDYQIALPAAVTTASVTPSVLNQPTPVVATEGLLSNVAPPVYSAVKSPERLSLSNVSNVSDDHDPRPDFKPIVVLPDEVPLTTGEENETVLFCEHAKLFRFAGKEWRERGVGDLKILLDETTGKARVLMRRDQVHKICANHFLSPEMAVTAMPKNSKAYFWAAQDYADGNLEVEKFCVRFKTEELAESFATTFDKAKADKIKAADTPTKLPVSDSNILGGFVFSSPPIFKKDPLKIASVPSDQPASICSPFATFTFGTPSNKERVNVFGASLTPNESSTPVKTGVETAPSPKTPDDFVPTAEFTPVIELPLVEMDTGEEGAEVLFEEHAKLLRFDGTSKEWKERGTGQLKILKQTCIIRLLMRRELIHKVCCNHKLLKSMSFVRVAKNPKAITWSAQDYSGNTFKPEIFTVRFKTEEQADKFVNAVQSAQNSLDTHNLTRLVRDSKNDDKKMKGAESTKSPDWGERFKFKQGHWECKICYVVNEGKAQLCVACDTARPAGKPPTVQTPEKTNPSFSFGSVSQSPGFVFGQKTVPVTTTLSWGDAFKPKEGTWECPDCLVRNEPDKTKCVSCSRPKDGAAVKDLKVESSSIKFNFGLPPPVDKQTPPVVVPSWGDLFKAKPGTWECKLCYLRNDAEKLYCSSCESPKDDTIPKKDKAVDLSTPGFQFKFGIPLATSTSGGDKFVFGSPTQHPFEFTPRSPGRRRVSSDGQGEDDSESCVEEEVDDIYFKPVIPLPDKVEVKSGEEDETVLYCHRAKLFRFVGSEWKERGIGDVKILQRLETGKARVLMRREQVLKICLNYNLTGEIEYIAKDEKTWLFSAADYSEGELNHWQFCLRFKNAEIAGEFKAAIDEALTGQNNESDSDVEFVSETKVTPEEEQEALNLQLPKNFMAYRRLPDCDCDDCKEETTPDVKSPVKIVSSETPSLSSFSFKMDPGILSEPVFKPASFVSTGSLFKTAASTTSTNIFGGDASKITFAPSTGGAAFTFGNASTIFGSTPSNVFGSEASKTTTAGNEDFASVLKCDSNLSFANLAANTVNVFESQAQGDGSSNPFVSLGAGAPVFASLAQNQPDPDDEEGHDEAEPDPHFEPIVPLPEIVAVSTGEEEEVEQFNERGKVYRFDAQTKEWKERGVGQFKILHHPIKGTYRFLLRREQVHKVVLNMLITPTLDLQPMSTSDKAWLWWGHNHVEGATSMEQLAARFKTCEIAQRFHKAVTEVMANLKEAPNPPVPETVENFEEVTQDESDEEDDRNFLFSKSCSISENLEGKWKVMCTASMAQIYYDSEVYGSRIVISDQTTGELLVNSIIGLNTTIEINGTDCTWRTVDWSDGMRWRYMRTTFEDVDLAEAFHCAFLESIQYAHESDLVDGIYLEQNAE